MRDRLELDLFLPKGCSRLLGYKRIVGHRILDHKDSLEKTHVAVARSSMPQTNAVATLLACSSLGCGTAAVPTNFSMLDLNRLHICAAAADCVGAPPVA